MPSICAIKISPLFYKAEPENVLLLIIIFIEYTGVLMKKLYFTTILVVLTCLFITPPVYSKINKMLESNSNIIDCYADIKLEQNIPNPFDGTSEIRCFVPGKMVKSKKMMIIR
jgi:hypothetical protein